MKGKSGSQNAQVGTKCEESGSKGSMGKNSEKSRGAKSPSPEKHVFMYGREKKSQKCETRVVKKKLCQISWLRLIYVLRRHLKLHQPQQAIQQRTSTRENHK